jgi:hypothetical protein
VTISVEGRLRTILRVSRLGGVVLLGVATLLAVWAIYYLRMTEAAHPSADEGGVILLAIAAFVALVGGVMVWNDSRGPS